MFVPKKDYFDGLFGVFADSLPDNWGKLLLNRLLRANGKNPDKLTVLERLAIVGKSGMGALTYYPEKENDYSCCAKQCGITMSETKLFPSDKCEGYFGTKRFDRIVDKNGKKRVHMLTAAALLELDFEQPSLDYHSLMKLTKILTRDNPEDVRNMFRRMCFNVFAHNRDDHSKNFTYLYHEAEDCWRLSPAYDLTYSNTYYGEHTTTVNGNGLNPGEKEILAVGVAAGIERMECKKIMKQIEECVKRQIKALVNKG